MLADISTKYYNELSSDTCEKWFWIRKSMNYCFAHEEMFKNKKNQNVINMTMKWSTTMTVEII